MRCYRPGALPAVFTGVMAVMAVVMGMPAAEARPTRRAATPVAECKKDQDCAVAPDSCCGCNAGGKQRALPARAKAGYEKKMRARCKDTGCPAVMSDDDSCAQRAVCKEGTCALGS